MKIIRIAFFLFGATAAAWAQKTATVVSNLGQPATSVQSFGSSFGTTMSVARAFTTDNTPGLLATVSVSFGDFYEPFGGLGPFNLSVCSDSGGHPGSGLATLAGNNYPTNAGIYTFTNTTPLLLLPNTTYWIVGACPESVSNASYRVYLAGTNTADAGSFWTLGFGAYKFGTEPWFHNPDASGLAGLEISVAVEPQAPAMTISPAAQADHMVLTYPTPDFVFVLQQNSDLTTANWVHASGGTVINNQTTTVTVPRSGRQMFYRLNLQ